MCATRPSVKKESGLFYIENEFYRAEVNQKGQLQSLYDKDIEREVIRREGFWGNEFILAEDLGCFCFVRTTGRTWREEPSKEPRLAEDGPLFSRLVCETRIENVVLEKELVFYGFRKRIDFHVTVRLPDGEDERLRVVFPASLDEGTIVAETPFGYAERREGISSMVNWVDYAGKGMGLAVFNRGIPSYEVKKGNIYLNLIKGLSLKDPMRGCLPPPLRKEMVEKGDFEFSYAIQSHGGELPTKEMVKTGYEFNMPLLATTSPQHQGRLPSKTSFVSLEPDNLLIHTIKKAERGEALVARIYETEGKPSSTARLTTSLPVESYSVCNLLETDEGVLEATDRQVKFAVKGHEIVTLKLNLRAKK